MSPLVSCVTFPLITLVYLLGLLLCFGVRSHLSSHAFQRPSPPITPPVLTDTTPPFPLLSPPLSPQWCERNEQCRRLRLRDLLVAPLQRLTRYPLLLRNIVKRCPMEDETRGLQAIAEQVDMSICERLPPPWMPSLLLKIASIHNMQKTFQRWLTCICRGTHWEAYCCWVGYLTSHRSFRLLMTS